PGVIADCRPLRLALRARRACGDEVAPIVDHLVGQRTLAGILRRRTTDVEQVSQLERMAGTDREWQLPQPLRTGRVAVVEFVGVYRFVLRQVLRHPAGHTREYGICDGRRKSKCRIAVEVLQRI